MIRIRSIRSNELCPEDKIWYENLTTFQKDQFITLRTLGLSFQEAKEELMESIVENA